LARARERFFYFTLAVAEASREKYVIASRNDVAQATANPNPIMVFIMRLFAAAAMTQGCIGPPKVGSTES
jgi:hypothetical protein